MDRCGGYDAAFIADLYDHVTPYRERPDAPFYVDEARRAGGPVLELGCGTGRVLLTIARAGVEVVGLDLSASMRAVCRERLAAEPADVPARATFVEADMRSFELGRQFALARCPAGARTPGVLLFVARRDG